MNATEGLRALVEADARTPAVVDGVLTNLSVSQMSTFSPGEDGCNRKWWRRYVLRDKKESTKSAQAGEQYHRDIELYLKTGDDRHLSDRIRVGKHFIPKPGPDLLIEYRFTGAQLQAAGVPVNGKIDLMHRRGRWVDTSGGTFDEKYGLLIAEVEDWKTTGQIDDMPTKDGVRPGYAKKGGQLIETIQMAGYGKVAQVVYPGIQYVRLSHGYFQTGGKKYADKRSAVVSIDTINSKWLAVENTAREMIQVARETDQNKVTPNWDACSAFGGCPYRAHCPRTAQQAISDLLGKGHMQSLLRRNAGAQAPAATVAPAAPAAAPAPQAGASLLRRAPAQAAPAPASSIQSADPEIAREMARLREIEARSKAGQEVAPSYATQPAAPAAAPAPQAGAPLCFYCGEVLGPQNASRLPDGTFKHIGCKAQPAQVTPPDAPASQPHLNAAPLPAETAMAQPPAVQTAIAAHAQAAAASAPASAAEPPKPARRGRRSQAQIAADTAAQRQPSLPAGTALNNETAAQIEGEYHIFVDCVIDGLPVEDLREYVGTICDNLCAEYNAADVRCAPKDSPLAFGGWKGALAACIRSTPPAPGAYYLFVGSSEIMAVVAETMQEFAAVFVRGVR